jgi:hypothetical protein
MSLAAAKSRLSSLTKDLWLQWHETRNYWKDSKSEEFEREYLSEVFLGVDRAITAMEKLDEVLAKVRKDCE